MVIERISQETFPECPFLSCDGLVPEWRSKETDVALLDFEYYVAGLFSGRLDEISLLQHSVYHQRFAHRNRDNCYL